jgi:hypothetical protein
MIPHSKQVIDTIIVASFTDSVTRSKLFGLFCTIIILQVIWSHATNTQADLALALAGRVMMIEADVSLGMQMLFVISTFVSEINK